MSAISEEIVPKDPERLSLLLATETGAMINGASQSERVEVSADVLESMRGAIPERVARLFTSIKKRAPRKTAVSEEREGSVARLEQFGREIQDIYRSTRQSAIMLIGTNKMTPRYAMAASLALNHYDLAEENDSRTLILACCSDVLSQSDKARNGLISKAARLSAQPFMRGKAGLLHNDIVYALPGLEAKADTYPVEYTHKCPPIAVRQPSDQFFSADSHTYDFPLGVYESNFSLANGVKTLVWPDEETLEESGNPKEKIDTLVSEFMEKAGEGTTGIVLKTKGFSPITEEMTVEQLMVLADLDVPVMVVGNRSNPAQNTGVQQRLAERMIEKNAFFMDGNGFPSGQAKVILARAIAKANQEVHESGVMNKLQFIREYIDAVNRSADLENAY